MESARCSILLLDDNPRLCETVADALRDAGYEVTSLLSSMECLKLLDAGRHFDLMIMDIRMPPETPHGLAMGRMARVKRPGQKIIYITGADELPEGLLENGEAPVVRKPFKIGELLQTIEEVLAHSGAS